MNLYSEKSTRFYAVSLFIAAILTCASISAAFGQERSTDRDKPTVLTSNEINDDLDGSADSYFYKFTAGPGKLTVTLEVKASGTNAGATLDLFGANARPILSDVLAQGVDGGSERLVNSVQLSRKSDILMRIKGVRYGDSGGTGTYKLTLDGPVNLAQGAPPAAGGAEPAPAAPAPAAPAAAAPANPTLFSGEIDGTEDTFIHIVNVASPGSVTFNFSVKPSDKNAGAFFAATDAKGKILFTSEVRGVGGSGTDTKTVNFVTAQRITVFVKGMKKDDNNGLGTYSIQLSGPATFIK